MQTLITKAFVSLKQYASYWRNKRQEEAQKKLEMEKIAEAEQRKKAQQRLEKYAKINDELTKYRGT